MPTVHAIVPCLWFDDQAEPAAAFYTSIFPRSRVTRVARYPEAGQAIHGRKAGTVMTVAFELDGQPFTALNGGPHFKFTEAISFQVMCQTQDEIDRYAALLSAGGSEQDQQCGWLKDKFGLSWQIVPTALEEMMVDADPARAARVMTAMLAMKKLDLAKLKAAHRGEG